MATMLCPMSLPKSVTFFSIPSPTTYMVKEATLALLALSSCSTVCLPVGSLTSILVLVAGS
jgi:hypothetical protein